MQDAFNQRRHQLAALRSSSPRVLDRDDELALFLEMRNREKERNDLLLRAAEDFDAAAPLGINAFFFIFVMSVLLILLVRRTAE